MTENITDTDRDTNILDVVRHSYRRCMQNSDFLLRFYKIFMERHEIIPFMFAKTHMAKQAQSLAHGLNMMIRWLINRDDEMAGPVIEAIRVSHGQQHLNIHPNLYDFWIDSLVDAVAEFDPEFTPDIESAWRVGLLPGIDYIRSGYSEN